MKTNQPTVTGEGNAPRINTVSLKTVNRLEKLMGVRVWDGVFYNRDGITNPTLTIIHNQIGREIQDMLLMHAELLTA